MNRRTYLGAAGCAGLASLAGCIGLLGLDNHEANPVGVREDVRADTEYHQTGVESLGIEEDVDMQLWSETITVTNYIVEHEKRVGIEPLADERAAVFVVLSTPQITVVGQQVNPVQDMSTAQLVELVAENYDDIGAPRRLDDDEVTVLDQDVTVSTFVADARFVGGQNVEVNLHVTEAIETEDDLVVGIGVYPRQIEGRERGNIEALITAIDPDVDVRGDGDDGSGDDGEDGSDDGENDQDDDDDDGGIGTGIGL